MRGVLSVAAVQPPCAPQDVVSNARSHADAIRDARARLVVFPELSLTGYELDVAAVPVDERTLRPLVEACAETGTVALVGAPIEEAGSRFISALRVGGEGVAIAYRKSHLGGDELARFDSGDGPTVLELDGWRVGLGICKDTGVAEHTAGTAALGIDLYAAGLAHLPEEIEEQDARGERIAAACSAYVVFASFAGPTGGGYDATAGESTIWAPDGTQLARVGAAPGEIARAVLDVRATVTAATT